MHKTLKTFLFISGGLIIIGAIWIAIVLQQEKVDYQLAAEDRPILGNSQATVVVEEFSDFQCPACRAAVPVVKGIVNKYKNQIKFIYRHFPLLKIHPRAYDAALASECANDQGKFWQYHDLLFANQPNFKRSQLMEYARELGLDSEQFSACLQSRARRQIVDADLQKARELNLNSTPTFIVNGQIIRNWSSELEAVIVRALENQLESESK